MKEVVLHGNEMLSPKLGKLKQTQCSHRNLCFTVFATYQFGVEGNKK